MKWFETMFLALALALAPILAAAQPRVATHYSELNPVQPVEAQGKVEVIDFFWYGCPYCYRFEPLLSAWAKRFPADVDFRHVPAILSPDWEPHARFYYAFETLGVLAKLQRPFFDAIHRDRLRLDNNHAVNQWLERNGPEPKKFAEVMHSFAVSTKVRRAAQLSAAYRVGGVPTLAVHGRYTVSADQGGGLQGMLANVDHLLDVVRKDLAAAKK
jgi:thiol:disulfide interchange protein DsbA